MLWWRVRSILIMVFSEYRNVSIVFILLVLQNKSLIKHSSLIWFVTELKKNQILNSVYEVQLEYELKRKTCTQEMLHHYCNDRRTRSQTT